jgi:hypothetical protein
VPRSHAKTFRENKHAFRDQTAPDTRAQRALALAAAYTRTLTTKFCPELFSTIDSAPCHSRTRFVFTRAVAPSIGTLHSRARRSSVPPRRCRRVCNRTYQCVPGRARLIPRCSILRGGDAAALHLVARGRSPARPPRFLAVVAAPRGNHMAADRSVGSRARAHVTRTAENRSCDAQ